MAGTHVLALDQGTTGTTAVVVDPDGLVIGRATRTFAQHYPRPGWVEHDPGDLWATSLSSAGAALAGAGVGGADLAAVGITNQRETVVVWDRRTGEALTPAVVWQDRRTAGVCDGLRAAGLEPLVRARTGLVVDPYFSGTKLAWLLDHTPGLRTRAERGEVCFGTVDSWLLWRLTGGAVHATDVTNASRTMLFDITRLAWDDELLGVLGVPRAVLPEVHPSLYVFATTVAAGPLPAGVPVAGILGDQQAALFAQACFAPGQTKTTYGTGSFVLTHTGDVPVLDRPGLLTTVAASIEGEAAQYALEGSVFVTGAAVQWLRDGLGIIADAAETEALAASVADTGDVWFVPALAGLGSPQWDPYARGTLIGITRGTTRAHVVRAVLESIAWSTRDVLAAVEAASGVAIGEVRVDGGAVANRFLMQFQADVAGVVVDVAGQAESTALGSAMAAGMTTGVWAGHDDLTRVRTSAARYEPGLERSAADAGWRRWSEAVARSAGWARPTP